jgi:hypothetical protein
MGRPSSFEPDAEEVSSAVSRVESSRVESSRVESRIQEWASPFSFSSVSFSLQAMAYE